MAQTSRERTNRLAFVTGFLIGSSITAISWFMLAKPSGRRWIKRSYAEGLLLKNKGEALLASAKQKSIALQRTIVASSERIPQARESERMIPIPKDYISQ
ncbi:MAG: hypothetical protein ABF608_12695 [Sporolactobacillus sp.]